MSSWVCRRFTQNTAWLPHQCLTFLQPIHNLEPDDVTFMETEHRAFICNKVTLCNHVVWVLEGEKGKNTEKKSLFLVFLSFFLNSSNTCVCFICVIVVYLCVSGRWYNLLKLNVSGELCVCVCALYLFDLIDEHVYEVFDLWCLGWEQYELLIGQIELQHVLRWDGHKQDVGIAGKKAE